MLLPASDVVIVLGSRNSSNSNRLAEIAKEGNKPARDLIDAASEIDPQWLEGCETVVTAGASARKRWSKTAWLTLWTAMGPLSTGHTIRRGIRPISAADRATHARSGKAEASLRLSGPLVLA